MKIEDVKIGMKVRVGVFNTMAEGTVVAFGKRHVIIETPDGAEASWSVSLMEPIKEFTKKPTIYVVEFVFTEKEDEDGFRTSVEASRNENKVDKLPDELIEAIKVLLTDLI